MNRYNTPSGVIAHVGQPSRDELIAAANKDPQLRAQIMDTLKGCQKGHSKGTAFMWRSIDRGTHPAWFLSEDQVREVLAAWQQVTEGEK